MAQSAGAPRSGRGGRRFKSCHSDQCLADNTTITGTDCGTVLSTLTDTKTRRISPIHDETEFPQQASGRAALPHRYPVTELEPNFAAENVGYFTAPYEVRHKLGKPVIDRAEKAVHVKLPNGVTRTAKYLGSQGCVTLPVGQTSVNFTPANVANRLPDPSTQPWPMGDVLSNEPLPPEIAATKLKQAIDAAFDPPASMTAAFVVTWRGRLIAERYGNGIKARTPLERRKTSEFR